VAVLVVATAVGLGSCAPQPKWHSHDVPVDRDVARLFRQEGSVGAPRDPYVGEIADVPMRINMRPCCAFGAQLHVRVGPVPIPFIFLGNIVDPRRIRRHVYDAGNATLGPRSGYGEIVHTEGNGLVYTCRAGFLDIAHMRDYADTALYVITAIARELETGGEIPMPDEGAKIQIAVSPVSAATIQQQGRWSIAIPLGQWIAFQSSIWHEIATWYGWSTFALFPEKISAFSPEDLYSNLLGARIAAAVISQRGARDEFAYNRNVERWLNLTLDYLKAVPVATGEEAMRSVDGLWWDSKKRIPDMSLVLRRHLDVDNAVTPWLVPASRAGELVKAACGTQPKPLAIANPSAMSGIDFETQAMLVIDLPPELAAQPPFDKLGSRITQKDFPAILDFIRTRNREMFGPLADRPDVDEH
jgi:hypothetical protein